MRVLTTLLIVLTAASGLPLTASTPASWGACFRRDTLLVMPLETEGDLDAWVRALEAYRGIVREATPAELHRYRDAAIALGRPRDRARATAQLIRHYRINEPDGDEHLRLADEMAVVVDALPEEDRWQVHNAIGNAKSAAGFPAAALRHRLAALRLAHADSVVQQIYALGNLATNYASTGDTLAALETTHRTIARCAALADTLERRYNNAYDFHTLGRIYRARGLRDSARYYLEASAHAAVDFPAADSRAVELDLIAAEVAVERALLLEDYPAALSATAALAEVDATRALLYEVDALLGLGQLRRAYEVLAKAELPSDRKRASVLRALIDLARRTGRPDSALAHAQALAAFEAERARKAYASLNTLSHTYLSTFERERAGLAQRHADELALLASRQRTWLVSAGLIVSLALAGWALRRSRRSSRRSANLSTLVDRHKADLEFANEALARQVTELREFNHLLSHDLREPLRSISGFAKLIGRRLGGDDALAADFGYLQAGIDQLQYLHEGVERLRKTKERRVSAEGAHLETLVRGVVSAARAEAPHARISVEVAEGLGEIETDVLLLQAVLWELLDNAVKFHPEQTPQVRVEAYGEGADTVIAVADDGLGIPREYRAQVFRAFKRLHRREEYPGAGIGLAVAHAAAARIGGALRILDRTSGPGVRVELRLGRGAQPKAPEFGAAEASTAT